MTNENWNMQFHQLSYIQRHEFRFINPEHWTLHIAPPINVLGNKREQCYHLVYSPFYLITSPFRHFHIFKNYFLTLEFWSHNVSLSAIFHLSLNRWYIIIKMQSCTYLTHNKIMMTSSNGNIFRVTGLLFGEFTGPGEVPAQRPVTQSFDVFFDLRLNKRLSKQPWGWWFKTLSWSLWR